MKYITKMRRRERDYNAYQDHMQPSRVAQATRLLSGWGLKLFDYDNDGSVDLILENGHPDDMIESYSPRVTYREPMLLFHRENGVMRNVSSEAGPAFKNLMRRVGWRSATSTTTAGWMS
jgi:hypothetical protein